MYVVQILERGIENQLHEQSSCIYVVNVNVECNLNLPKNIKKKYIFILNRVLKPTTLYMWTFDISLFLYEKKGQIIHLLLNFSNEFFKEDQV